MEKEYPTINGLEAVLKILEGFGVKVDYVHQEIIRGELLSYRKKVLEKTFGIEKDPVPAQAVEVSTDEGDKGVFILFVNPVDYIELVEEDGTPTSEEEVIKMKMSFLIGLMVNKDNPQKTQLSFIPPEFLLKLKEVPEEKPLILEEDLGKENKKQSLDN